MPTYPSLKASGKGFTLVELLVVIAIIGLLASVVLSSLGIARARSRDARRKADMNQLVKAFELYYSINNTYPPTSGWVSSTSGVWTTLGTTMSSVINRMPIDPQQSSSGNVWTDTGVYGYGYFSDSFDNCIAGQWYVLVFKLERTDSSLPTSGYGCSSSPAFLTYTSGGNNYVYIVKSK
jgi:prepilin-type N-terminal cleavage/methylation domain-containing protein